MIRCSNCLLPETNPNISFDSEGICNYCHNHKKIEYLGEEKLKELLANYRGKGKPYDCVIGLSGGRDSSFTLLKMVKIMI